MKEQEDTNTAVIIVESSVDKLGNKTLGHHLQELLKDLSQD